MTKAVINAECYILFEIVLFAHFYDERRNMFNLVKSYDFARYTQLYDKSFVDFYICILSQIIIYKITQQKAFIFVFCVRKKKIKKEILVNIA